MTGGWRHNSKSNGEIMPSREQQLEKFSRSRYSNFELDLKGRIFDVKDLFILVIS